MENIITKCSGALFPTAFWSNEWELASNKYASTSSQHYEIIHGYHNLLLNGELTPKITDIW
jgi:hypothetical protein